MRGTFPRGAGDRPQNPSGPQVVPCAPTQEQEKHCEWAFRWLRDESPNKALSVRDFKYASQRQAMKSVRQLQSERGSPLPRIGEDAAGCSDNDWDTLDKTGATIAIHIMWLCTNKKWAKSVLLSLLTSGAAKFPENPDDGAGEGKCPPIHPHTNTVDRRNPAPPGPRPGARARGPGPGAQGPLVFRREKTILIFPAKGGKGF